jgi:hypothetical protein
MLVTSSISEHATSYLVREHSGKSVPKVAKAFVARVQLREMRTDAIEGCPALPGDSCRLRVRPGRCPKAPRPFPARDPKDPPSLHRRQRVKGS